MPAERIEGKGSGARKWRTPDEESIHIQDLSGSPYKLELDVYWGRASGQLLLEMKYSAKDGSLDFDIWSISMSREATNRLIRVLRKARDQAFGADA